MAIQFAAGSESIRTSGTFPELDIASVCMWFRPRSVSGNNRLLGTDTAWEARLSGSDMLHEFRQGGVPDMTTVFAVNTWYHLVFTFDGTTKQAYVNGTLDVSSAQSHAATGNDTVLSLGTSTWNETQGIDGDLEDVRIYNRVLSAGEASQINTGRGRDRIYNGLVHWWTLNHGHDGDTSISEPDLVGSAHMNVIVGTPEYRRTRRTFIHDSY